MNNNFQDYLKLILCTYLQLIVNIKPFRVVVHFLSEQSHFSHKPKGFIEVLELVLLLYGISVALQFPACLEQSLQLCVTLLLT